MLNNLKTSGVAAAGLAVAVLAFSAVQANTDTGTKKNEITVSGERYEALVPDTLDLADRARYALNTLTKTPDPNKGYAGYQNYYFNSNPPYLEWPPGCMEKYIEAMPLMRIMCGSDLNLDVEKGMIEKGGDGPRIMQALMYRYACDRDPVLLKKSAEIAENFGKAAIYRGDYAYYPLESSFNKETGKWEYTDRVERDGRGYFDYHPPDEPSREQQGIEGHVKRETTDVILSLSRWVAMTGDKESLKLCEKLMKYVMKPDLWEPGKPPDLFGVEHGIFEGHFHGNIRALRGILEYAMLTNNKRLKQFVRDGYEYARNFGIARIGWFPMWIYPDSYGRPRWYATVCEGCCVADMTALAVKLSDAGVGDYWEDVDQYARNQLVEQQVTDANILRAMAKDAEKHEIEPGETAERAIERSIGSFMNFAGVTHSGNVAASCCTGNCSQALYYVWEGIVRCENGAAQVNLLLNRASPWLDIDSYLPYEGKVVIKNKTAKSLSVRIPDWVDKKSVKSALNEKEVNPFWVNNYLVFKDLSAKDVVVIEFPMVETTEKYRGQSLQGVTYECKFRGNTLVDISPREEKENGGYSYYRGGGREKVYPTYRRDYLKRDKAPMKKIIRYVSPVIIKWHL
jgi:hypothetical protein